MNNMNNNSKATFQELPMSMPKEISSPPPNSGMIGGKKSVKKTGVKKTGVKKSESDKPVAKKGKKGGALMNDIKNLAVPFAILLAKQGLQSMFDKKKSKKGGEIESSPTSLRRHATIAGGSCGSQCAVPIDAASAQHVGGAKPKLPKKKGCKTKKGGAEEQETGARNKIIKSRFEKLSKEIDQFLQKY
jgi:hypothetical protein